MAERRERSSDSSLWGGETVRLADVGGGCKLHKWECRFIVADFTGQRGGVYFEAGYALGLRKPVIWTCKRDWFNKTMKRSAEITTAEGTKVLGEIEEQLSCSPGNEDHQ